MTPAPELQPVSRTAAVWHRYDRAVKADLWSTALRGAAGVYLVDPTEVDRASLAEFVGHSAIAGIVVTNANHMRNAPAFSSALGAPLLTSTEDFAANDCTAIDLPGAAPGEIALVAASGELIVGDALINFEPYGFTFLPDKYCTDARQMRHSLGKLLAYNFDRIFFAHGAPIIRDGHERLAALLASANL